MVSEYCDYNIRGLIREELEKPDGNQDSAK